MSRYRQSMKEAIDKVYEQGDHEVSMARGELEAIADKATKLASSLQGKSDEGNPLEAWVQSKITKAKDYINSVSDYLMYNPEMAKEETILDEGRMKDIFTANQEGESAEEIAKRLKLPLKTVKSILGEETELDEKVADSIIRDLQKAYAPLKGKTISPDMANRMSKHLDGQSFDVVTLRQLMKAKIPFISTLARNKIYKKTGKFEELVEARWQIEGQLSYRGIGSYDAFHMVIDAPNEQAAEQKAYKELDKARDRKKIGPGGGGSVEDAEVESIERTSDRLQAPSTFQVSEKDPVSESNIDVDNVDKKDSSKEKELKIKLDKEKDQDALEKQLIAAQGQINILKAKLENEKNRTVKPEPNPETGEVPLTVGIAHKLIKDKQEKEMKKEDVDNYPTSDINKKKHAAYKDPKSGERKPVHLGAKMTYESIAAVKKKAEKTGMPYSVLKKVYDRGMAAWRGGHRPGATQVQWALARVNSFVTKSSGTWGGADKDLAKQVRGSKK